MADEKRTEEKWASWGWLLEAEKETTYRQWQDSFSLQKQDEGTCSKSRVQDFLLFFYQVLLSWLKNWVLRIKKSSTDLQITSLKTDHAWTLPDSATASAQATAGSCEHEPPWLPTAVAWGCCPRDEDQGNQWAPNWSRRFIVSGARRTVITKG